MSSIVPSARVAIPTLVNKKNFAVRKVSVTTPNQPVTSQNTQPTHTHGTLLAPKKNTFRRKIKYNGGPAYCLLKTNPKQTSTFFNYECKFLPCTTDDERTGQNILTFKFSVISSFFWKHLKSDYYDIPLLVEMLSNSTGVSPSVPLANSSCKDTI